MAMALPREAPARPQALVVLEDASARAPDANQTTVCRRDGELPAELALRTIRLLASIEHRRGRVRQAVLVAGDSVAAPMLAARRLIARTLLAHVARAGGGRLLIAAGVEGGEEQRRALLELAESLREESPNPSLSIELCLDGSLVQPPPDSGVRARF